MRIQLLSDLHSELYKHLKFKKFVDSLNPTDVDVLLLAGDIGNSTSIGDAITWISEKYKNSQILHCCGNHEFWKSSPEKTISKLKDLDQKINNYHFLNNQSIEIGGQRFLGGTLWFKESLETRYLGRDWSDFHAIQNGQEWIYRNNVEALEFFDKELKKDDIVFTHHLPSHKCVSPAYQNDRSNCFFVCPMDNLIIERKPKLWCFGHTHDTIDLKIGKTRCISNPFGYHEYNTNPKFKSGLIFDI